MLYKRTRNLKILTGLIFNFGMKKQTHFNHDYQANFINTIKFNKKDFKLLKRVEF